MMLTEECIRGIRQHPGFVWDQLLPLINIPCCAGICYFLDSNLQMILFTAAQSSFSLSSAQDCYQKCLFGLFDVLLIIFCCRFSNFLYVQSRIFNRWYSLCLIKPEMNQISVNSTPLFARVQQRYVPIDGCLQYAQVEQHSVQQRINYLIVWFISLIQ